MGAQSAADAYDQVFYPSAAEPSTHPDRLATVATLFGMRPAPVERCRVLELGCADGANLVPMAYTLPRSTFLGIDASARQIAAGQARVAALGLKNIRLQALDLQDLPPESGEFDYIIAHGVYSWVAPPVQNALLALCRRHLAPNGVAVVSYNALPGWHQRGVARDLLRFHTRQFTEPQLRVSQSRALLAFLADATALLGAASPAAAAYAQGWAHEQALIAQQPDGYVLHEHLGTANEALYVEEFVSRAGRHGLQYVSDAAFTTGQPDALPPEIAATIERIAPDRLAAEQYMDFVLNRTFRTSLLCRREVALRAAPQISDLHAFRYAASVQPEPSDGQPGASFRSVSGTLVSIRHPLPLALLRALGAAWPQPLDGAALLGALQGHLDLADAASAPALVGDVLLRCALLDLVELRVSAPPNVFAVSERPVASAVARLEARGGATAVTNGRHEPVALAPALLALLPLLDGTRPRAALLAALGNDRAPALLEQHLAQLAQAALLTEPHPIAHICYAGAGIH